MEEDPFTVQKYNINTDAGTSPLDHNDYRYNFYSINRSASLIPLLR